jgi:hypothetical protein
MRPSKVKIQGGIGNQLFQYSLYLYLNSIGNISCLDLSVFRFLKFHYGFELHKLFSINPVICNRKYTSKKYGLQDKIFFHAKFNLCVVINRLGLDLNFCEIYENRKKSVNLENFNKKGRTFVGAWQHQDYLINNREFILSKLTFKNEIIHRFESSIYFDRNSVIIHVRGGDYREMGWQIDRNYYLNSISIMNSVYNNELKYYVITDDILRLEELNLPIKYEVIDLYQGSLSYLNLYLMANCLNLIVANSTFSWWGAYLNRQNSIICVPANWFNDKKRKITFLNNWKVIDF